MTAADRRMIEAGRRLRPRGHVGNGIEAVTEPAIPRSSLLLEPTTRGAGSSPPALGTAHLIEG